MSRIMIRFLSLAGLLIFALPVVAQSDFEKFQQQRDKGFDEYKKTIEEQFAAFKAIYREETEKYQAEISTEWDDPELSTRTVWVEYSDDLQERTKVDFEANIITIEVVGAETDRISAEVLRAELTELVTRNRAEAFADDVVAQAVEQRGEAEIDDLLTAEVEPKAILLPYLTGMLEVGATVVREIVEHMAENATITSAPDKEGRIVRRVVVPLTVPEQLAIPMRSDTMPEQLSRDAQSFWGHVNSFASTAEMDRSLIYAVIETESAFNPLAKSHIPAYGLMQIVPESAGLDVTQQMFGKSQVLSASYLYNAGKNIEVGAIYLNILYYRYLRRIEDPLSRLYCTIAAYNTGPGNVAKTFTGKMKIKQAVEVINRMSPEQVYSTLEAKLPYEETRRYLKKVSERMEKYKGMGL